MAKVRVLYYSSYGHTKAMASAMSEAVTADLATGSLR